MKELCRTNDMVLLSYLEAVMKEAGVTYLIADIHMSVLEGSLGVLPRRVLVDEEDWPAAVAALRQAGVAEHLTGP